jgi:23S rRNA pseudouridine2605 synthase
MSQAPFQKFVAKKKNSVVKEEFRQEKKKAIKERRDYFEKKKKEEYELRMQKRGQAVKPPTGKNSITGNKQEAGAKAKETTNPKPQNVSKPVTEAMPLNKYIAHCGICSRRDAVALITNEKVTVNKTVITEPGFKVSNADEIIYNNKKVFVTKNLVYILLNKPKDYITTSDDPQGRKTVVQLIATATTERVYPIGRLDRNTSGVLLMTNDGELTQKLSHPSYEITKIYEAKLDKPLTKADFDKILKGLKLEDGEIKVDSLAYADSKDKSIIGIELHSGRNRIVRRIFEFLGYDVKALDRVVFANLTKKNVERGRWRYLSEKEIRLLKYMNASKKKAKSE